MWYVVAAHGAVLYWPEQGATAQGAAPTATVPACAGLCQPEQGARAESWSLHPTESDDVSGEASRAASNETETHGDAREQRARACNETETQLFYAAATESRAVGHAVRETGGGKGRPRVVTHRAPSSMEVPVSISSDNLLLYATTTESRAAGHVPQIPLSSAGSSPVAQRAEGV